MGRARAPEGSKGQAKQPSATLSSAAAASVGGPAGLLALNRAIGNRSTVGFVQRKMAKGDGWNASFGSGLLGGTIMWSQTQLDQAYSSIATQHSSLLNEIAAARSAVDELAQPGDLADRLDKAQSVHKKWDIKVGFSQRDEAERELRSARDDVADVKKSAGATGQSERQEVEKQLGELAGTLSREFSTAELHSLLSRVPAKQLGIVSEGITPRQVREVVGAFEGHEDILKRLAGLKGPALLRLAEHAADPVTFVGTLSAKDVAALLGGVSDEALAHLSSEGMTGAEVLALAKGLTRATIDIVIEKLDVAEIGELRATVPDAVTTAIAQANATWLTTLHEQRDVVKALIPKFISADRFVQVWKEAARPDLLKKLWKDKPAEDVGPALASVGGTAIASLMVHLTQVEFFDYIKRLDLKGTKGFGESMTGKDIKTVAPNGASGDLDAVLKALGKDHAGTLKAAKTHLGAETLAMVIEKCQVQGLDAAKVATFLIDANTQGWKKKAQLEDFFALAGARIEARATLAKEFAAEGNTGTSPDVAGGAPPATAEATVNIGGKVYSAAKGDISHYMAGHSWSHFAMTDANAGRGDSSMLPKGTGRTGVVNIADGVLNHASFVALANNVDATGEYQSATVGAYRVGVDENRRMTMLYPTGGRVLTALEMRAVAKLFQSK